jgi:poly-gamma-glutamate synthesis protein (capsule biosynthesis protein)
MLGALVGLAAFGLGLTRRLPARADQTGVVTFAAVGDLMLGRSIGSALSRDGNDTPFLAVRDVLRTADVTVGNLECPMGTCGVRARNAFTFLAPPAAAGSIADAGFDGVSLANNHALDCAQEMATLAKPAEACCFSPLRRTLRR